MSTGPVPQLVDITTLCTNFPDKHSSEISRENILHTLTTMLDSDTQLLVLHGVEGIGKTTLLAQFARANQDRVVSIFLRPGSRYGYDPDLVFTDVCNQLLWLVGDKDTILTEFDDALLRRLIYRLQQTATQRNIRICFLVDGLEEIPEGDSAIGRAIIDKLPTGLPQFKFIFSSNKDRIPNPKLAALRSSGIPLTPFGLSETIAYFGKTTSSEIAEEFYRVTKGVPGDLASFKRIVDAGTSPQQLLDNLPASMIHKYELEWNAVDTDNELQLNVLAITAHDRTRHTARDLAFISNRTPENVIAAISSLSFIQASQDYDTDVQYISESFRKFAVGKLGHLKVVVDQMLIDAMLGDAGSTRSMLRLPGYLHSSGQNDKLLSYLSPDHFLRMLEHSQSLAPVKQHAELGLATALKEKRDADLLRFAMQESSMADLDGIKVSRSEISARVAVGDFEGALALAATPVLRQDRLRLLAAFCRAKKEQHLDPEQELIDQIQTLLREIDIRDLGDRAMELAVDLMHFIPDKAIKVVERMTNAKQAGSLDLALANLSLVGLSVRQQQESHVKRAGDEARRRITDPDILNFSTAIALMLGKYSAAAVMREAATLTNPADQLFLLRSWTANTRDYNESLVVVQHSLDLAIKATEYTPNATHFRQLAMPLRHSTLTAAVQPLIGAFDSHKALIEKRGPTEDYVWLQLLLAQAESQLSFELFKDRLVEVYLYVAELTDLVTKASCLARLASVLATRDRGLKLIEAGYDLHTTVNKEFSACIDTLLSETAEHEYVVRAALSSLATSLPQLATSIALQLNIETRRDLALAHIIKRQLQASLRTIPFAEISAELAVIVDCDDKENLICQLLQRVADSGNTEAIKAVLPQLQEFIGSVPNFKDTVLRTRTAGLCLAILTRCDPADAGGLTERYCQLFKESWSNIDDADIRVELGFETATTLAQSARPIAIECLAAANQFRNSLAIQENSSIYMLSVKLAIRAYAGLLLCSLDAPDDYSSLSERIERVPSIRDRIRLWTEIALRAFGSDKPAIGKKIVHSHLRPAMDALFSTNPAEWARAVALSAPALYSSHAPTALELVSRLPREWVDLAYDEIMDFAFCKQPGSDPYDRMDRFPLTFEQAIDICNIAALVQTDWVIYKHVEFMVESLLWKTNHHRVTVEQRNDIERRLRKVVERQLPTPRFIKHEGFKVLALAQLERLRKGAGNWAPIIERARLLPNIADRSMVLACLPGCATSLRSEERRVLFEEAKKYALAIPSLLDKIERLQLICGESEDVENGLCKQTLKEIIGYWGGSTVGPEFEDVQRRVIDTAHRVDENLAVSLVSGLDNDPARIAARAAAQSRLRLLRLTSELVDQSKTPSDVIETAGDGLAQAAWKSLGSLNSGRQQPVNIRHTREYVKAAAKMPLSTAFPILAWAIENNSRNLARSPAGEVVVRGVYQSALLTADLVGRMVLRSTTRLKNSRSISLERFSDGSVTIIKAGDRDIAVQYIEKWLANNAGEYLKIADPYIGPEELGNILRMVLAVAPGLSVTVLTSKRCQPRSDLSLAELFRREWRRSSDQDPPLTHVSVASTRSSEDSPIHDRWWISKESGLRLGTSFGSIGVGKDSEISKLDSKECSELGQQIDQYIFRTKCQHRGERIVLESFTVE